MCTTKWRIVANGKSFFAKNTQREEKRFKIKRKNIELFWILFRLCISYCYRYNAKYMVYIKASRDIGEKVSDSLADTC